MNIQRGPIFDCICVPASKLNDGVIAALHMGIYRHNFMINQTVSHQVVYETVIVGVVFLTDWLDTNESICVIAPNLENGAHYGHELHGVIELATVLVELESEVIGVHVAIKLMLLDETALQHVDVLGMLSCGTIQID